MISRAANFAFLPRSSDHSTVFDILNDQARTPELWTNLRPLDTPIADLVGPMKVRFDQVAWPLGIVYQVTQVTLDNYLKLLVVPTEAWMEAAVRAYRDQLSQALGVRKPYHEVYEFHITLAYRIWEDADDEAPAVRGLTDALNRDLAAENLTFALDAPEFCRFEDMSAFPAVRG